MIPLKSFIPKKYRSYGAGVLLNLGLFLLALAPRVYDLFRFVTADEAKWVYRSAQFLAALLQGDLAGTSVNLTPAVTTTWLGSLGLWLYYQLHSATIGQPLVAWLAALPEFQPDLSVLVATRWSMVLFTSLGVVLIYRVARPLLGPGITFLGAGLIALDPHLIALSRILGHDAPTALFMTLSLLLFLKVILSDQPQPEVKTTSSSLIITSLLSGAMAGLAFLSKAPALFLVPLVGLLGLSRIWATPQSWPFWSKHLLLWSLAAYLAFIVCWPAAWIEPIGRPAAVVQNAFLSATDTEEAGEEGYWRVPDLGSFYYLVNGAFKLSPLVMVGWGLTLGLAGSLLRGNPSQRAGWGVTEKAVGWLFLFILLFTLFMTWGEKRSARYLLPIFPTAALIAAYGWLTLSQRVLKSVAAQNEPNSLTWLASAVAFPAILLGCACLILLPYIPYYFTYFNPLLGGSFTAPYLVKIGWGEGLDQVGRFLQRELPGSRVGTAYASTLSPYFKGDLAKVEADQLDYIVLYLKQIQGGEPSPTFIHYFEQTSSIFSVDLNGIDYAKVYPGPALRPVAPLIDDASPDEALLRPTHFRPLTSFGHRGEALEVDVIWQAEAESALAPVTLTLQPLNTLNKAQPAEAEPSILAESVAPPLRQGGDEGLIISRHSLPLPENLERGAYALFGNGYLLGEIEVRDFRVPTDMIKVENISFNQQIALTGYQFEPTPDYVGVTLAWQAQSAGLPDYTVFVQLLEAETNERLAGVDLQPLQGAWPTSRWVKDEVVVDEILVAVPPEFKPGFYKVIVGLYRPETGQRLTLPDGQDYWLVPWTFIRKE
jgi:hypothetical protein